MKVAIGLWPAQRGAPPANAIVERSLEGGPDREGQPVARRVLQVAVCVARASRSIIHAFNRAFAAAASGTFLSEAINFMRGHPTRVARSST